MLGLDVSPSMGSTWGRTELAALGLDAKTIAAAMAMVTLRTEKYNSFIKGYCHQLVDLGIIANMSLEQVKRKLENRNWGSTDCSAPMVWALKEQVPVDVFITYTDNDTNSGRHPMATLKEYRDKMGIPAKMIVCGTEPHKFSIADPDDPGCLDICGFDSSTPKVISEFSKEEI
jgi:60 kDa SS-A/Ro ribonucleoprotein